MVPQGNLCQCLSIFLLHYIDTFGLAKHLKAELEVDGNYVIHEI